MANNPYNPILHTGGNISSRDKIYHRDVTDGGNISNTVPTDPDIKINNNSISYVNSSNVVVDRKRQNEQSLEFPAAYDAGGIVYKKDTASANGPYKRPQTVNGPLISPLVIAQVWTPPQRSGNLPYLGDPCDLADDGKEDPANPCFVCYSGYWLHMNEIRSLGICGEWIETWDPFRGKECEEHRYDFGACFKCDPTKGVEPLCHSDCEECVVGGNGRGACRSKCQYACLEGGVCVEPCIEGVPEGALVKPNPKTCNKNLCEECGLVGTYQGPGVKACVSYCGPFQTCVNGECKDRCSPHCLSCEECVFRDGVWGCRLSPVFTDDGSSTRTLESEGYGVVCCQPEPESRGEVVQWRPGCESLGPNCTVVDECAAQNKICDETYDRVTETYTFACKDKCKLDSDCGPCKFCNDNRECESICKGFEVCVNDECVYVSDHIECKQNCEALEFHCTNCDPCDITDPACWECVDRCPQDVLPLKCLPVAGGFPGQHACQYQETVILANIMP